ncbi:MAG: cobyrinate a,c-diamide synthase [Ferrimicrobium sp.]
MTLGLLAALGERTRVGAAKVGPDYIDPHLHALAIARPSYNLDPVLTGAAGVKASLARAARHMDLVLVEGVMGLFDGTDLPTQHQASEPSPLGSTAQVAKQTALPVLLIIDCAHLSQSVAAIAHGYRSFDPDVRIAGVILNHTKSATHEAFVREALALRGIEVLGVIPHGGLPERRARHLGLLTAEEAPESTRGWIDALGEAVKGFLNLERIVHLAAPIIPSPASSPCSNLFPGQDSSLPRPVIAYSEGPAASFIYPENLERLREAGADIVGFDPRFASIPEEAGLIWLHGGYPENYREELAANEPFLGALRQAAATHRPLIAECGGHLVLGTRLEDSKMAGILPFASTISSHLTLGYRLVRARASDAFLIANGDELPAHEFHYATSTPEGTGLTLTTARGQWQAGYLRSALLSSYLHWHLGANEGLAARLVAVAARHQRQSRDHRSHRWVDPTSRMR